MSEPLPAIRAQPRTPRGSARLARVVGFLVVAVGILFGALAAAARIPCGEFTLLGVITHNYLRPGGRYQSLRRFREADERGHVDIVFFGSSHAYRGFDPRIFEAEGYLAENLGSTNQTPLNTRYLVERYLPRLRPSLVVIEVYDFTLSTDGLEACRDLTVNTPPSWPMFEMAVATQNLGAISFALAKGLRLTADEATARQEDIPGEEYVPGGYVQTREHRRELMPDGAALTYEIREEQVDYLERATGLARASGAKVVWVTHPLPEDHVRRIPQRARLAARIDRAATRSGVEYWDFQERLALDPQADFADFHHLSASGVERFDRALLEALQAKGYLKPRAAQVLPVP